MPTSLPERPEDTLGLLRLLVGLKLVRLGLRLSLLGLPIIGESLRKLGYRIVGRLPPTG